MRTKFVLKNLLYSMSSYVVLFILGLINRKIFLDTLPIEFLGYEGLFADIFSMLSLAEMGVGSVITYNLYHEIAVNNKEEISKLMMIYKYIYRIVGFSVLTIGIGLAPFLQYIISYNNTDLVYIRFIYFLQLMGVIATYFLAYRRTLFLAYQKEYVCVKIDTVVSVMGQLIKIFVLVTTKNYLLYLFVTLMQNVISNILISKKCNKTFFDIITVKITLQDFKDRHFFKDIKNFMIHKVSYMIYGGVDNIVISMILGINVVGLFSNYMLFKKQVLNVISLVLKPLQASIGNYVYSDNIEKGNNLFIALDLFSYFMVSFISITFFIIIQPFIEIFFGAEYVLSLSFVLFLTLNIYIGAIHEVLYYFRSAFGEYERERGYMVLSAILNLVISIALAKGLGLTGIIVGTVIGMICIWYGRVKAVFGLYLRTSYKTYILKHLKLIILTGFEGLIVYILSYNITVSIPGLVIRLLLCILVPNILNLIIFYKTKAFNEIKKYVKQILFVAEGIPKK